MNKFYVYAYMREDRYTPYYIGKGCGKRCYYKSGKNCKPPKDRSRIIIIKDNLLENDASKILHISSHTLRKRISRNHPSIKYKKVQ